MPGAAAVAVSIAQRQCHGHDGEAAGACDPLEQVRVVVEAFWSEDLKLADVTCIRIVGTNLEECDEEEGSD